jgi:glycyl-tRNA synthetase
LGTPFCITVDHQTLEDQTVTIRYRDSMAQERLTLPEAKAKINAAVSFQNWLGDI